MTANTGGLTDKSFVVKKINAVFGTVRQRQRWYRVEWEDYPGQDTWEPERSLVRQGCECAIKDFWKNSNLNPSEAFIADPDDVWRYYCCGKGFTADNGLKRHVTCTHPKRNWHGSMTDKITREDKRKAAQEAKPHVNLGKDDIENVILQSGAQHVCYETAGD